LGGGIYTGIPPVATPLAVSVVCAIFSEFSVNSSVMTSSRRHASLVVVVVLLMSVAMESVAMDNVQAFNRSVYCARECSSGTGGDYCKCTVAKFAGKRNSPFDNIRGGVGGGTGGDGGRHHVGSRWIDGNQ